MPTASVGAAGSVSCAPAQTGRTNRMRVEAETTLHAALMLAAIGPNLPNTRLSTRSSKRAVAADCSRWRERQAFTSDQLSIVRVCLNYRSFDDDCTQPNLVRLAATDVNRGKVGSGSQGASWQGHRRLAS